MIDTKNANETAEAMSEIQWHENPFWQKLTVNQRDALAVASSHLRRLVAEVRRLREEKSGLLCNLDACRNTAIRCREHSRPKHHEAEIREALDLVMARTAERDAARADLARAIDILSSGDLGHKKAIGCDCVACAFLAEMEKR